MTSKVYPFIRPVFANGSDTHVSLCGSHPEGGEGVIKHFLINLQSLQSKVGEKLSWFHLISFSVWDLSEQNFLKAFRPSKVKSKLIWTKVNLLICLSSFTPQAPGFQWRGSPQPACSQRTKTHRPKSDVMVNTFLSSSRPSLDRACDTYETAN